MPSNFTTVASGDGLSYGVAWMVGALLSGVAYGIEITLALNCIHLLRKPMQNISRRTQYFHFAFIITTCFLGTAAFVLTSVGLIYSTLVPLDRFNTLPNFWADALGVPFSVLELILVVLVTWGSDGFMLWRCVILYEGVSTRPRRILFKIVVTLMILISLAFGACGLATPSSSVPWEQNQMLLRFEAASLAINVIVSVLIVCRILYHKRYLEKIFGKGYGSAYTKVIAICIESAMLTLIWNILFIVLGNTIETSLTSGPEILIVFKLIVHINIIYPLLIIFRVAQGKAFPSDPTAPLTSINFRGTDRIGTLRFVPNDSDATSTTFEASRHSIPASRQKESA